METEKTPTERIAVYGLGKMGLPLALVFATSGFQVIGADIDKKKNDMLNAGIDPFNGAEPGVREMLGNALAQNTFSATDNLAQAAAASTIHIILVPTLIRNGKADIAVVHSVCMEITKSLKKEDIVVTECTMPPGETDALIRILQKNGLKCPVDFGIAHCPERTMSGTAIRDITGQYPKIIGASDKDVTARLAALYEKINRMGVVRMDSVKEAEAVKVFEGVYRDVNIALANELTSYCAENGLDAIRIFNACNTMQYCHIHMPGYVGGHCIPYYPQFIAGRKTELINTARRVNESVLDYILTNLKKGLESKGKEPRNSKILLLGLTFRGGVREFEHSAALGLLPLLRREGVKEIYAMDPLCNAEDGDRFGVLMRTTFRGMDAAVVLTDHKEFRELNWQDIAKQMRTLILIDIRNVADPNILRGQEFWFKSLGRY